MKRVTMRKRVKMMSKIIMRIEEDVDKGNDEEEVGKEDDEDDKDGDEMKIKRIDKEDDEDEEEECEPWKCWLLNRDSEAGSKMGIPLKSSYLQTENISCLQTNWKLNE